MSFSNNYGSNYNRYGGNYGGNYSGSRYGRSRYDGSRYSGSRYNTDYYGDVRYAAAYNGASSDYREDYSNDYGSAQSTAAVAKVPFTPEQVLETISPSSTLKWPSLYPGQTVYLTCGMRTEPVTFIRKLAGGMCVIQFEGGGRPMVWRRRLFSTKEEAERFLLKNYATSVHANSGVDIDSQGVGEKCTNPFEIVDDVFDELGLDSPFPTEIPYSTESGKSWPRHNEEPEPGSSRKWRAPSTQPWRNGYANEPGDGWARR